MKSRKLFKVCALLMLAVMSCLLFSGCGGQSEQKKFRSLICRMNRQIKMPMPEKVWRAI